MKPLRVRGTIVLVLLAMLCAVAAASGDVLQTVGYRLLQERLGDDCPDGAGVLVAMVEAASDGAYLPNAQDSHLLGKTFEPMSGASATSWHATTVASYYVGHVRSAAPGVEYVQAYKADHWLTSVLRYGSTPSREPVSMGDVKVVNHSWIQLNSNASAATDILRRADYLVERDGLIHVAGANNGSTSELPWVLSSLYNGIVVGRSDLGHSPGPTTLDEPGRSKPDLVAPTNATSWSTPLVGGTATMLVQDARSRGWADAERPEAIKSILMASAEKLPGWTVIGSEPLDRRQGAGSLRVDRAWRVLDAGQQSPSLHAGDVRPATGWDFGLAVTEQVTSYWIELSDPAVEFTANLTWLRRHAGTWRSPSTTLDDLWLGLYGSDGLLAMSNSAIDNVEHLYLADLPAGLYRLEVGLGADYAAGGEQYGLAWFSRLMGDINEDGRVDVADLVGMPEAIAAAASRPGLDLLAADLTGSGSVGTTDVWALASRLGAAGVGDVNLDGVVDVRDLAIFAHNWEATGANWLMGDFTGDGRVAEADLELLREHWSVGTPMPTLMFASIPEPATAGLLLMGIGVAALRRRRGRTAKAGRCRAIQKMMCGADPVGQGVGGVWGGAVTRCTRSGR